MRVNGILITLLLMFLAVIFLSFSSRVQAQPPDGFCDDPLLRDVDQDNYNSIACGGNDCDDSDAAIHPGAHELCDGKDNDCDGQIDEQCSGDEDSDGDGIIDTADNCPNVKNAGQEDFDNDGSGDACDDDIDGDGDVNDSDCNDYDAAIHHNASEICDDGVDNNCDGQIDESGCTISSDDQDNDGIIDTADNCPTIFNPSQQDSDEDDVGDACESISQGISNNLVAADTSKSAGGCGMAERNSFLLLFSLTFLVLFWRRKIQMPFL